MERQESELLLARVERLERRLRVAVVGWVVSIATVVVLGVAVQAISQPEVLRARRIEVVDTAGRARIVLGVLPDGSLGLGLWDAAGRPRIGLGVAPDRSPALGLSDAAGRPRIGLVVLPDGSPVLGLWDAARRELFRAP